MAELKGLAAEIFPLLAARFPEAVRTAESDGIVVDARQLLPVVRMLRDELGFVYLSSVTGVDYPQPTAEFPARIDVVYHFYRLEGGSYLALHAHTSRTNSSLPSLTPEFPSADFQEREIWDMFGVRFEGHPDLRRLLLWEGFDGFPLRKDWKEPYYEEEHKPFKSRFPDGGHPEMSEERAPLKDNVRLPQGWSPQNWDFEEADKLLYQRMLSADADPHKPLPTDEMILNMGPHHPSTHGVFRLTVRLDGETVRHLEPVFGYLHRNHEKIGERNTWLQNIPFTDRLDYINGMTNNLAYVIAMEKLLGLEVPPRAQYLRVIMAEFARVINHMLAAGFYGNDVGIFVTAALYAMEERELILDLFEAVSGGRMLYNYMRPGGVAADLPDGWIERALELVNNRLPRKVESMQAIMMENEIVGARSKNVGTLTKQQAIAYGVSGPVLRASGVPYDVRRAEPYLIYDQLDFDVITAEHGDAYDRLAVRFGETWQSLRILRQVLTSIPEGPIQAKKLSPLFKVPAGETYGRIEAPKGELGFYLISDGSANPYRYHVRSTSLINLTPMSILTRGHKVADVVAVLGSIDLTMGEVDR